MTDRIPPGRRILPTVLLLLSASGLAACQGGGTTGSLPTDNYRSRYPIVLREAPETLDIPVGRGSAGLAPSVRDNVRAFAAKASAEATGTVVIMAPAGTQNEAAATSIAVQAERQAVTAGLSRGMVERRRYAVADPEIDAPVRLAFLRMKAEAPPCGQWTEQAVQDSNNGETVEFGCATQANLAAMIANPYDLILPRVATGAPAGKVVGRYDKWLAGEETTSATGLTGGTVEGN